MAIALISFAFSTVAQNETEEFKQNGKPIILVFSNFHTDFADGETHPEFEIKRAYLGYEHNFSENWSGRVILDVGDPGNGSKLEMTAYLKNAYFEYKKGNFTAYFGMIATTQFKVSEKIWGYRYIEKSFQDAYKFNSSADIGFNLDYKLSDLISVDFSVFNGEGYKKMQGDDILRPGFGTTIKPLKNVTARGFVDFMGKEVKQNSIATFLGYSGKKLVVGAEYNYQKNVGMADSKDLYGPSVFATYKPADNLKLFGRFDELNSNTLDGESQPWNLGKDGQLILLGMEFSPAKGLKLAPNFRGWNPADDNEKFVSSIYLNCEIKF